MRGRPAIDVSELPTVAFGSRAPLWWGVAGVIAIEGTMFALLVGSYLYLRGGARLWPPTGVFHPGLGITAFDLLVLLASAWPVHLANKAALRADLAAIRRWLSVAVVLGVVFLAGRVVVFDRLTFLWSSHAYGSLVWTTLGLHTFHALAGTLENLVLALLFTIGPVEDKHLLDVRVNGMYWFFVAVSWVPLYALFFLDPGLLDLQF